jgi:hypothetical protein
MDQTLERWLPVAGHEGVFEVSDWGRVRSLDRWIEQGNPWGSITRYLRKGRILSLCGEPYKVVRLRPEKQVVRVHILVARAFLSECPGPYGKGWGHWNVDHIDGDTSNNRADNLQWLLRRENSYVKGGILHDEQGKFITVLSRMR